MPAGSARIHVQERGARKPRRLTESRKGILQLASPRRKQPGQGIERKRQEQASAALDASAVALPPRNAALVVEERRMVPLWPEEPDKGPTVLNKIAKASKGASAHAPRFSRI
jgi:hypothetical protein